MAPKFKGGKWVPQSEDDMPSAGYGVSKTFFLQGPKPALTRLFQPDDYEQAVLKFMAGEQCDRVTAQGNMDFYLRSPQDWQENRYLEEKRGIKRDYTQLNAAKIVSVLAWSTIVLLAVGRGVYCQVYDVEFVSTSAAAAAAVFIYYLLLLWSDPYQVTDSCLFLPTIFWCSTPLYLGIPWQTQNKNRLVSQ